jgi:uncharacterized membrane protein (DUF106 family)
MEKEEQELIDSFVENSVSLQKILSDAIISMNRLTQEISDLLGLFKEAARTVEEHKDTEMIAKLDELAEQNKTIAKSLSLMIEKQAKPLPEFKF